MEDRHVSNQMEVQGLRAALGMKLPFITTKTYLLYKIRERMMYWLTSVSVPHKDPAKTQVAPVEAERRFESLLPFLIKLGEFH